MALASLEELYLSNNHEIGDIGLEALAEALKNKEVLPKLNICQIGNEKLVQSVLSARPPRPVVDV